MDDFIWGEKGAKSIKDNSLNIWRLKNAENRFIKVNDITAQVITFNDSWFVEGDDIISKDNGYTIRLHENYKRSQKDFTYTILDGVYDRDRIRGKKFRVKY